MDRWMGHVPGNECSPGLGSGASPGNGSGRASAYLPTYIPTTFSPIDTIYNHTYAYICT